MAARCINALVYMYHICDKLSDARQVFEEMPNINAVSWNTIITAYAQNKRGKDACGLFNRRGALTINSSNYNLGRVFSASCQILATVHFHIAKIEQNSSWLTMPSC